MLRIFILFLMSFFILSSCTNNSQETDTKPVVSSDKKIIAIGDSLTIGLGLPVEDNYPSQLQKKLRELGYEYTIENAGISGDTTAGLLSRIDWILEGSNPEFVILCIGANDAFQGKTVPDIEKNLRSIIEKIRAKNIPILFAGMKAPFNLGTEYRSTYDSLFPKLAQEYKLDFVPFLLEGIALNQKYNQDDRIHPNREGYAVVVTNIMDILLDTKLLKK